MTQTTELRAGAVSIRDDDNGDGRTIEGTALVYGEPSGETKEYGAGETFARGAFRQALANPRAVPFFARHQGEMIGAVSFEDTDEALRYKGRLFDTPAAAAYREAVRAGIDGASIEFMPGVVQRTGTRTIHKSAKALVAIAGSHMPAYPSARVAVRQEEAVVDTIEPQAETRRTDDQIDQAMRQVALTATSELRRELAERAVSGEVITSILPPHVTTLAQLWHAIDTDRSYRGIYTRALVDQITTNNPGVMGGGNILGTIKGIIVRSRPAVEAFGREALGGSGMSVDYPYFNGTLSTLVGEQLTQKAEITSARVDLLKGTAPIRTFAGGSDISYQLLRRSDPAYLEAYLRIMFAAYAVVTDAAFVNAIEALTLPLVVLNWATATPAQIQAALANASVQVQTATGSPAEFGLAAPDVFGSILGANLTVNTTNGIVTGNAANTLSPVVSGLRIYADPAVNTGNLLVSNDQAASWHEDGPYQVDEEDVARLGRNVAVWGMGATTVYVTAGIIRVAAA